VIKSQSEWEAAKAEHKAKRLLLSRMFARIGNELAIMPLVVFHCWGAWTVLKIWGLGWAIGYFCVPIGGELFLAGVFWASHDSPFNFFNYGLVGAYAARWLISVAVNLITYIFAADDNLPRKIWGWRDRVTDKWSFRD